MREVIFEEVGMENFGPYIDPMILKFNTGNLVVLEGRNGIGKTMSIDAVPFTLFGITTKKLKGDEAVNNSVGKNCKTWVKFKIDKDQYLCTRYQKYKSIGNTVILAKNGVDIKKGSKEVITEVEKLLCPQKAFMNTLMFGQKVKDFFTDLVDSDKKEIFRKIINLEIYIDYYKKADEKIKEITKIINEINNGNSVNQGILSNIIEQIKILNDAKNQYYIERESQIKQLKESLSNNERLLEQWKLELQKIDISNEDSILKELSDIQNQLLNLTNKYDNLKRELQNKKQIKQGELKEKESNVRAEIKDKYLNEKNNIKEKQNKIQTEISNTKQEIQNNINELKLKVQERESVIRQIIERISEIKKNVLDSQRSSCPTCEQEVNDEIKDKLIEKIKIYEQKIDSIKNDIININDQQKPINNELNEKINKLTEEFKQLNIELNNTTEKEKIELEELKNKLTDALNQVEELSKKQLAEIILQESSDNKYLVEKESQLLKEKENIDNSKKEQKNIENTINKINQIIVITNDKITSLENTEYDESQIIAYNSKIHQLNVEIQNSNLKLEQIQKRKEILEFWKHGFSSTGIPSMLIDEAIPFMNETITKYLDLITNGRYLVSFDTLSETKAGEFRDKISVNVLDTHTKANQRTQLSGGQTRIIDIATILTLGDLQSNINNVKFNILIFDEIFDSLDDENIGYVSKVLNKLKKEKAIYIISHQHQDQLEADEILKFT